jgi:GNAT superfamily N-acetyltransferase
VEIRRLAADAVRPALTALDRSEHVDVQYEVVDGVLRERPVRMADVPRWDDANVDELTREFAPVVERGGHLYVASVDGEVAGVAIVDPVYDPPLAWFALLHVSRAHRRTGVASALWASCAGAARAAGATSMYVSASSTGSAVGFYRSRGCVLADPPRPELFEQEPLDVHLVCDLTVDAT